MTESWCGLLNVLILSIVAGANGVLIARTQGLKSETVQRRSQRENDEDQ